MIRIIEDEKTRNTLRIIQRVCQPIITVFLVLGIILFVFGTFLTIKNNNERKDGSITRAINSGEYAFAYKIVCLLDSGNKTDSMEYEQALDFKNFYEYVVDYKIGQYTGNRDKMDIALVGMSEYMKTSDNIDNKPHFEYIYEELSKEQ